MTGIYNKLVLGTSVIIVLLLVGVTAISIYNLIQPAFAPLKETTNKQLGEAIKALQSGDNAAAEGYMKEADKTIPEGAGKMHLGEAIKALQSGDIEGAKVHAQAAKADME